MPCSRSSTGSPQPEPHLTNFPMSRLIPLITALLLTISLRASPDEGDLTLVFSDGLVLTRAAIAADSRLSVQVRTVDGFAAAPYRRTIADITNTSTAELTLASVVLLDRPAPAGAHVVGDFSGSPIVTADSFLGVEHPLADNRVKDGRVRCALPVMLPLRPQERLTVSLVQGSVPEASQLRRTFLAYLEKERARPYAPFLHHNTWYNLGYFTMFTEADELHLVDTLGAELATKRGVKLDGFVLDDGWDDTHSLWRFHSGWPDALQNLRTRAAQFGAAPGLWLSPWGGYGKPRQARLTAAAADGFEIRNGRFSLAGPRYYERFRGLCASAVREGGAAYFKFDGIGADETGVIDPTSGRDFAAMLRLVHELRDLRPGLYISQTTGTWPSPWWLLHVDNIWRDGEDHDFAGPGTSRQRWLTYRDSQTYANVVRRGPLFPLNSLMLHGIIFAQKAKQLNSDPGHDFTSEVRSYFGTGTQLQELYLSPELLNAKDWDDLAAAANWARANTATLLDTHWIGGDPGKLEVYGWAAWSPAKGLLTLRNPADHPASFSLEVRTAFELPAAAPTQFAIRSAYADQSAPFTSLTVGAPVTLTLQPFEVIVLEASPTNYAK